PKFWRADVFQTGSVPIWSLARQRPASLHGLCDGVDVGCFRVDVQRRRIVLHDSDDFPGLGRRPTGPPVAAAPAVTLQLPERNGSVSVRVRAARIFSKTDIPQQFGRMSADFALPGVCDFAFAVKLNERAYQNGVFREGAVIAFERRFRLSCYMGPTGRQSRIQRIAEILRAPLSIG